MGLKAFSTTPDNKEFLFLDLMVGSLNTELKQHSTLLSVDVSLGVLTLSDHSQEGLLITLATILFLDSYCGCIILYYSAPINFLLTRCKR